ncbi:glycosyltransferase [Limisphaera sp. VF-2]|uniref:glycosyltransferase n=1 Tax=Limisphaera sp. VF-2 TaxID=3400418 RepID=UPI001778F3A7|nr:glycosyltransferase [Limisphaera sp.]
MSARLPTISIIIAARPEQTEVQSLRAAQQLDYPRELLEVLLARGRQPSVQRNAALRLARGELVYFLDDDSIPDPANLRRAAAAFQDERLEVLGGPNLCPADAPEQEQVFALVLSSWLAFGPSRARYTPVGPARDTTEKTLILCNLVARRKTLLELGGFDETLYPNEENALLDAILRRGGRLRYDPAFVVHRRPRPDLWKFVRMLWTYGRGRAEQFRRLPTRGSLLNFVPPLFVAYVAALVLSGPFWPASWAGGWRVAALPLGAYGSLLAFHALSLWRRHPWRRVWRATALVVLAHCVYGAGFWRGCFTSLRPPSARTTQEVRVEVISPAPGSTAS